MNQSTPTTPVLRDACPGVLSTPRPSLRPLYDQRMAYDQDLADLIRRLIGPDPDLTVIESQRGWSVLEAR